MMADNSTDYDKGQPQLKEEITSTPRTLSKQKSLNNKRKKHSTSDNDYDENNTSIDEEQEDHNESQHDLDEENKQETVNTSLHSSISPGLKSSSSSSSNKDYQQVVNNQPEQSNAAMAAAFEWCKQQMSAGIGMDRLLDPRNGLFAAGLQYLKPTPTHLAPNSASLSSSRISSPNVSGYDPAAAVAAMMAASQMDPRFYAHLPPPNSNYIPKQVNQHFDSTQTSEKQAMYTQYNGLPTASPFMQHHHSPSLTSTSNNSLVDSNREREHFLASFYNNQHQMASPFSHHFNRNIHQSQQHGSLSPNTPQSSLSSSVSSSQNNTSFNQLMHMSHHDRPVNVRRQHNSSDSRSVSPSSSQQSGLHDNGCDEDDMDDCDDSQSINGGANGEWTYEEQFKQLYELSDDPKRKEFLDELFAFMQKRGTPVNRIPIMAKHVLDLHELYKLVVAKGGLVEVINKKLWREITKGLNLPSSITSAAFTLRTQYMKYLYPYENEKLHLSTQSELNAAIDGNKREGRRPVYGYDHYPSPGLNNSISSNNQQMKPNEMLNTAGLSHHAQLGLQQSAHNHGIMQPHHFLAAAAAAGLLSGHHPSTHRMFDPNSSTQIVSNQTGMNPFIKQLYGENITPPSSASSSLSSSSSSTSSSCHRNEPNSNHFNNNENKSNLENENMSRRLSQSTGLIQNGHLKRPFDHLDQNLEMANKQKLNGYSNELKESMAKKLAIDTLISSNSKIDCNQQLTQQVPLVDSPNSNLSSKMKIKILSKKDSESDLINMDKAISISIELNGLTYQGTLFASNTTVNSQTPSLATNPTSSTSIIKTDIVY